MDKMGVHAQVQYPNLLGFHVWAFLQLDERLRLQCVQAFNDFQTEFCGADPGRLLPLIYLPWWDLEASLAELARCIDLGHKGVNFGCEFEKLGYPRLRSEHWDPLLRAIEEAGLSINFHIGFNNTSEEEILAAFATSDTAEVAKNSALLFYGNATCIAEVIMGGICHKFPDLRFVSVESGFSYVPYLLEALDWQFVNTGGLTNYSERLLPSEYFRRQIYSTFWFEKTITSLIHLYPDNVMFETDYPHGTCLSPGPNTFAKSARDTIAENLSSLPEETLVKILHDTAARVYGLGDHPRGPFVGTGPSPKA
jgi:predicted TIM-barrel fold metal-dependent hydrolase